MEEATAEEEELAGEEKEQITWNLVGRIKLREEKCRRDKCDRVGKGHRVWFTSEVNNLSADRHVVEQMKSVE